MAVEEDEFSALWKTAPAGEGAGWSRRRGKFVPSVSDPGKLRKIMSKVMKDGMFTDVTLVIGPRKATYELHSAVLACRSSFFRSILFSKGTWKETGTRTVEVS